jgi:hypothetical protein
VNRRERAIRAYASQHRAYLRTAHPDAWRAMLADGSIRRHCRRRAVGVWDMRNRLMLDMHRAAMERGATEAEFDVIPATVYEIVENELRAL